MFYEIYADRNVLNGGLWFDPDENEMIEVIDMQSAAGDTGVTMIVRGQIHVTEEKLQRAVESAGLFYIESPPEPPKGRKRWLSVPWVPPPKPGYLFWVPRPPIGPKVLSAWEDWTEFSEDGGKFEELPEDVQGYVFRGAEALHSYAGISDSESRTVIAKWPGAAKQKQHDFPEAIITRKPEEVVWDILDEMGVRRDE